MSKTGTGTFVQVDYHRINALFNNLSLSNKEAKNAVKAGLRQSGNIIKKQAGYNLQNVTKKDGGLIHYRPLLKFLRVSVFKNLKGVTITGLDNRNRTKRKLGRRRNAKDYTHLLRFFNMGADNRKTRKGYNRGSIHASHFFDNAVEAKKTEAMDKLSDNILYWINTVAEKRK